MKSLIVVCTGNMCRSPIAAGVLRLKLLETGLHNEVSVFSAGTKAQEGYFASHHTTKLLLSRGIPIRTHRTRLLQADDVMNADLVLVMEEEQRNHIFHIAPTELHKVLLFSELIGETFDIVDPMGSGEEVYENVLDLLTQTINDGWDQLISALNISPQNEVLFASAIDRS